MGQSPYFMSQEEKYHSIFFPHVITKKEEYTLGDGPSLAV